MNSRAISIRSNPSVLFWWLCSTLVTLNCSWSWWRSGMFYFRSAGKLRSAAADWLMFGTFIATSCPTIPWSEIGPRTLKVMPEVKFQNTLFWRFYCRKVRWIRSFLSSGSAECFPVPSNFQKWGNMPLHAQWRRRHWLSYHFSSVMR